MNSPLGQQAGVLRVQAEHQLVQVPRQPFGVLIARLHVHHDGLQHRRRLPRHRVHRPQAVAEPVRREEHVTHQTQPLRLLQLPDAEVVARRLHPREVGLDAYRLEGRHDEQRRRLQVYLVPQQLVERPVQLRVLPLELAAEMLLEVGVGEPARHPLLEGERLRIGVPRRRRMARQPAQVVEERLRPLPFAEAGVPPASNKIMRRHCRQLQCHLVPERQHITGYDSPQITQVVVRIAQPAVYRCRL